MRFLGGAEAQISIKTGDVLKGTLPRAKRRAVLAWLNAHREEVAYIWTEIRAGRYERGVE